MLTPTDDVDGAAAAVASSLSLVSKAIKQHADSLRQNSHELQAALRILFTVTDTPGSKIVVTGIGKSFLIGKKLAATLTSVGTRAVSLHATEALHGDMGIIGSGDCIIALSNSGETEEVVRLASIIHSMRSQRAAYMNVWLVGMGRSQNSSLGHWCDAWISCPVDTELSDNVSAPTVSSSLMLAVGDSIAIMLMNRRRFGPLDFARNHPGGALGQPSQQQTSTPPLLELEGDGDSKPR
ncbi:hypothetical protein IWW54_002974 [Coemansia sp. RSA 2705]|nr:hypothetical protein IWW54_002974 [Coemansia sp. RSA 2705]